MVNWLKSIFKLRPGIGDREFRDRFLDTTRRELGQADFDKNVSRIVHEVLVEEIREDNARRAHDASRRFFEFFHRLISRYSEIREIEWEMYHWEHLREKRPMRDIQFDFVNRTESFHQGLYASISALIKLVSHIAERDFLRGMPVASNSDFLDWLSRKAELHDIQQEIEILKVSSGTYRSRFIDHTNQQPVHDWVSYSLFDGKAYLLYTIGQGNGEFTQMERIEPFPIPWPIPMRTPFPAEEFFVPPHHERVIRSYMTVARRLLDLLNN